MSDFSKNFVLGNQIGGDYMAAVVRAAGMATACLDPDIEGVTRLDGMLPHSAAPNGRNSHIAPGA